MDFYEGIKNPNGLDIEDLNENILVNAYDSDRENVAENVDENANGNPLEQLGTNQQVMNEFITGKTLGNEKKVICDSSDDSFHLLVGCGLVMSIWNLIVSICIQSKPPNGLDKNDWRWLIKEVYSTDKFKKVSARNSTNRFLYQKELANRTGSKPFRQVIWKDLGAIKGIKPDLINVFYTTRKKDSSLPNAETTQKYVAQRVLKSKSQD
ncbi:BTB/POZ domain-containing protein NPY1 [Bienertia sinuspersici]